MYKYYQIIKSLRIKKGHSQEFISDKINCSRSTYIEFEKGNKDLSFSQILKLSNMLGISIDELSAGEISQYDKYKEMILAFIRFGGSKDKKIVKTKLAKMLYLADFSWFYEKTNSMSGMQYRKIQYGPVPNDFFVALNDLEESGDINIDHKSEIFLISETETSERMNKLKMLNKEETDLVKKIAKKWKNKTTKEIVNFTHKQFPYSICENKEIIPYELIIQEDPGNVY
jgi:transcriptional regulator with XRE-family HTH domain